MLFYSLFELEGCSHVSNGVVAWVDQGVNKPAHTACGFQSGHC